MPDTELGSPLDEIERLEQELHRERQRSARLELERDAHAECYRELFARVTLARIALKVRG